MTIVNTNEVWMCDFKTATEDLAVGYYMNFIVKKGFKLQPSCKRNEDQRIIETVMVHGPGKP